MNPTELRQTAQSISRRLESANATAQESIFSFAESYVDPCLSGFKACLYDFTGPCCPGRDEPTRRKKSRLRGRAEQSFDFYDDWDDDEDYGNDLIGWRHDELDSLLPNSQWRQGQGGQPRKQLGMTYGTRSKAKRSPAHRDADPDPTIIPSSSRLGFLERFPFKLGGKLRYKPSAAGLQEHPGGFRELDLDSGENPESRYGKVPVTSSKGSTQRRQSATSDSRSTTNSLSSRGDLIPSDDEADAIPLDDEFATALERRNTGSTPEDRSSSKSYGSRKSRIRRSPTRTASSMSARKISSPDRVHLSKFPDEADRKAASSIYSSSASEKDPAAVKASDSFHENTEKTVAQTATESNYDSVDAVSDLKNGFRKEDDSHKFLRGLAKNQTSLPAVGSQRQEDKEVLQAGPT